MLPFESTCFALFGFMLAASAQLISVIKTPGMSSLSLPSSFPLIPIIPTSSSAVQVATPPSLPPPPPPPPLQTTGDDDLAKFGQTISVLGRMERTDQDFTDGLALDLLSPKNRTLVVQQNPNPLPGNFVTGSTGETFVNLLPYSYIVRLNESAHDLIAKIELPYDPVSLQAAGIDQRNTYVGTLAPDGKSWVVAENLRNVHVSENKTRIIKLTSLDGEYMLLGRRNIDSANVFVQYGQGVTRTVNVTGGPGTQEAEFIDGLRLRMTADQPFKLNAEVKFGVNSADLPGGTDSLNPYSWVLNTTSQAAQAAHIADIRFPVNAALVPKTERTIRLIPAWRAASPSPSKRFTAIGEAMEMRNELGMEQNVMARGIRQLDGEYVLLVATEGMVNRRNRKE